MKLSLCITTWNRPELTIKAFEKVYSDPRIDEIVIVDDCSGAGNYQKLLQLCNDIESANWPNIKIRIAQNENNIGMSRNKARAIEFAKNEWCILFDSDNILDASYLNAFFDFVGNTEQSFDDTMKYNGNNVIYCPDFAKPHFNYTKFSNDSHSTLGIFNKDDAAKWITDKEFNMLMNTCNYIVNREFYLKTYQYNPIHIASDTIWHNYNHLKSGGSFMIVPGMQYSHLVHDGSGFMQDAAGNMARAEEVRKLIAAL